MNLQTKIPLKPQQHNQIEYSSDVLLLGSCFVENVGKKFDYFKFKNSQNPFGILFHPIAIENLVAHAIQEKTYSEVDIFFQNEQWHCFDAHSLLSNPSKEILLESLNSQIQITAQKIKSASHIIITVGTAWVYKLIETNAVVANCHKVAQNNFSKELLSVDAVLESLKTTVALIESVNTKAKVIFTVSPVRHVKDGFVENMQSKAHLISGIHAFLNQKSLGVNGQSHYFPSYEIMMDELRDYRFYAEDMIHPNPTAINYIWNAFKRVWISEKASNTMEVVEVIQKGLQHKPFNSSSEAHKLFLKNLNEKQEVLQNQFGHITF
ncbi:GSCFA domain-containing protein [Bizionia argentinensis JUB59]|uniref:GSCFA domain-containing protein n=1 Tax=Bizionia argentinensis JUB59 TaxID=1046627 RepID=G2EA51_9FLAO|nr:GSCFA domain-containing protein [Bizionia argentinensis]EGV44715.1 GSCFA domain-containing protein [Bizionia argentinensis JUB59]